MYPPFPQLALAFDRERKKPGLIGGSVGSGLLTPYRGHLSDRVAIGFNLGQEEHPARLPCHADCLLYGER